MEIEITTVEEVLSVIKEIGNSPKMYRGQSEDWPLLPSIGRYPNIAKRHNHWKRFQEYLLEDFSKIGYPYLSNVSSTQLSKLVFAQHHGLPTNLLDTSTNPIKALYFAVGDPTKDEKDGVLWIIPYQMWKTDLEEEYKEQWSEETFPLFPAMLHPRLNAQEGAFINCHLPENRLPLEPLEKIKHSKIQFIKANIKAENKEDIRKQISYLGAKCSLLFPDLDGVAKEIKSKLQEPWYERLKDEI